MFYSTLLVLFVASVAGLAVTTALLPSEPVTPLPVRSDVSPFPAG